MNILVVDDEIVQIETLTRGLKSKGYQIISALNAEEALGKLHDDSIKIDMVLTDYAMPGMNGMDLLKKIRKTHRTLPVIMMTAYGDKDLVIDALRNQCDSFIEKPFTLDQLMEETERAKVNILQNTGIHELNKLIPKHVHQINNPLMSIMGSAELAMLQLDDTEAIKNCIKRIIESAKKITIINKEIMKAGKKQEDRIDKVDLKTILNECLRMFKDLLTLKNVSVETDMGHCEVTASGNKFSMEQLFKNLILNAIDAMDGSNEKHLKISARCNKEADEIIVKINDTGCGIPEESLGTLFTPYFTSKKHGTGLGLPVVKNIVEKHKGNISVESQVGKGTTFTVTLPVNAAAN